MQLAHNAAIKQLCCERQRALRQNRGILRCSPNKAWRNVARNRVVEIELAEQFIAFFRAVTRQQIVKRVTGYVTRIYYGVTQRYGGRLAIELDSERCI